MMPHFDALYGSREATNAFQSTCADCGEPLLVVVVPGDGTLATRHRCPRDRVGSFKGVVVAAHPCNSCDGIDLPIVNDAGYCSACASDEA